MTLKHNSKDNLNSFECMALVAGNLIDFTSMIKLV